MYDKVWNKESQQHVEVKIINQDIGHTTIYGSMRTKTLMSKNIFIN